MASFTLSTPESFPGTAQNADTGTTTNLARDRAQHAGVIWISGFSAAGKTTVGRRVEVSLKRKGVPTIFLDGDDLRSIFAARWGYQREERVELAHVYFRLCSHLAAQGFTVVISAVAMYREVRSWVRTNLPHVLEVYLDVPEEERRLRDSKTKRIYDKMGSLTDLYDAPDTSVLVLANHGTVSAEQNAEQVVQAFLDEGKRHTDYGRESHWGGYYAISQAPAEPSPFASAVAEQLSSGSRLLEVGCGNGRDASFFASCGHTVTAIDASQAAIELCRNTFGDSGIDFRPGALPAVAEQLPSDFDAIYSRFVLHAMPVEEEHALLAHARRLLLAGGKIFIECRSINDPLARKGEVISPTERIHGHYRRFIVKDELLERLTQHGFEPVSVIEADNISALGEDNPVVIRVEARIPMRA